MTTGENYITITLLEPEEELEADTGWDSAKGDFKSKKGMAIFAVMLLSSCRSYEKAISGEIAFLPNCQGLQRLDVFSLPALGALGDVELDRLALLQALEAARLDR